MSKKDGLRSAKATVEELVTELTVNGKPGQVQTFLQWFADTYPAVAAKSAPVDAKAIRKQRMAEAEEEMRLAGHGHEQHGHSHGGQPCHGHGHAAPPPPVEQHGHSHGGKPCHGHGHAAPPPQPEQHGHSHGGKPCHGHGHGDDDANSSSAQLTEAAAMKLFNLRDSMSKELPFSGLAPGEVLAAPLGSEGVEISDTLVIDAFLSDDNGASLLMDDGVELQTHKCNDCGSKNIRSLPMISKSISLEDTYNLYKKLPDLKGKTVVNIGSRLGGVLYTGAFVTKAKKLVGIEKNAYFCELQNKVVKEHHLTDRVQILPGDATDHAAVLKTADVVFMHDVLTHSGLKQPEQAAFWESLSRTLKQNCIILACPSIQESVKVAQANIDVASWLLEVPIKIEGREEEDVVGFHKYLVRKPLA